MKFSDESKSNEDNSPKKEHDPIWRDRYKDLTVEGALKDLGPEAASPLPTSAASEINNLLSDLKVRFATWQFQDRECSSSAVSLEESTVESVPTFNIVLEYEEDVDAERLDRRDGNWSGKWPKTGPIRDGLNAILSRHGFSASHISDNTLIFAGRSREAVVFDCLGRIHKADAYKIISSYSKDDQPAFLFWSSLRTYTAVYDDRGTMKYVNKKAMTAAIETDLQKMLKAKDEWDYCRDHSIKFEAGSGAMNLYYLSRED
ncbi:MAG: hypothetical protein AAGK66_04475 [Pseudomonadota bacterium]